MFKKDSAKTFERVMRDFPWLWAIKSEWMPAVTEIRVRYADDLVGIWGIPNRGDFQIWIHLKDATSERVVPLVETATEMSLARQVRATAFKAGGRVQHIAMLFSKDIIASKDAINVCRPRSWGQDPSASFDRYLENPAFQGRTI